jgi:hypothetical protein
MKATLLPASGAPSRQWGLNRLSFRLSPRSRGRDVTSADVRLLASMCANLQVVRVAQVDSRDAVVLYKRAAQTVLEEGSARAGKGVLLRQEDPERSCVFRITEPKASYPWRSGMHTKVPGFFLTNLTK